jgi:signal transduction histidine kinase
MTATIPRNPEEPTPRELELLLDLTRQLAAGEHIASVLEVMANDFKTLVPFDRMEYSLVEDDHTMRVAWVHTDDGPDVFQPGDGFRYEEPIAFQEDHEPYLFSDLPTFAKTRPEGHPVRLLADAGYRASISCPLIVDGRVHAFVFLNTLRPHSWSRRHLTLVELISGHLSLAAARAQLTEDLRRSNEELRRAHNARAEFVASVSHEIRTPLTGIVGLATTMHDHIAELPHSEIAEFAGLISRQAVEVTELVDDLLVASRAETGTLRVSVEPVDVAAAITSTIESLGDAVEPTVTGTGHRALVDSLRFRQIIRNLLTNAARHGGPDIRIDCRTENGEVFVAVSDDGEGVPPHRVATMFEPFDLAGGGHRESVGLGLTVARSLAKAMGGDLEYSRDTGRTVMTVRVPAA